MTSRHNNLDLPLGRIELLGQVLHLVEHDGRLVAACTDEAGGVIAALTAPRVTAAHCRRLMRQAIDLLLDAAEERLQSRRCAGQMHANTC